MKSKISIEEANEWHIRNFSRPPNKSTIEAVRKIKKIGHMKMKLKVFWKLVVVMDEMLHLSLSTYVNIPVLTQVL